MKKAIIISVILLCAIQTKAAESIYDDIPMRFNRDVVIKLTKQCISTRLHEVDTDAAMAYLESSCLADVLDGTWNKHSRQRYLNRIKTTTQENEN